MNSVAGDDAIGCLWLSPFEVNFEERGNCCKGIHWTRNYIQGMRERGREGGGG